MVCNKAEFINFRNIQAETLEFSDGVNVIFGDNAQGKTNILEGINFHSTLRSHRAAHEKDMINFDADFAKVTLDVKMKRSGLLENLDITIPRVGRRVCMKNDNPIQKASEYVKIFKSVIFTPEHLSIVKEGPAERRAFLDTAICSINPFYLKCLTEYNKILKQRNKLLSDISDGVTTLAEQEENLAIWTDQLIESSFLVCDLRSAYVTTLGVAVDEIFKDMTHSREKVKLTYSDIVHKPQMLEMFKNAQRKECALGTTLYGPHKEDMTITLNGRSVRDYGSQGQQRSVALAIKLAESKLADYYEGEPTVLLLDDILSELDEKRKEYVMSGIPGKQVLITACNDDPLFKGAKKIYCKNGTYTEN